LEFRRVLFRSQNACLLAACTLLCCPAPVGVVVLAPLPRRPYQFGAWRSLVAHLHGVQGVAGSNPAVPTNFKKGLWQTPQALFYCLLTPPCARSEERRVGS